jgi:hypothetical protein
MNLVRWFHCERSLSVRPASPGPRPEANDGRPVKATAGGGSGRAGPIGRPDHARRHLGARQLLQRPTPIGGHSGLRARTPRPYCGVPRSRGPSPRSASETTPSGPRGPYRSPPRPGPPAGTRAAPPTVPGPGRPAKRQPGPPRSDGWHAGGAEPRHRTPPLSGPRASGRAMRAGPIEIFHNGTNARDSCVYVNCA